MSDSPKFNSIFLSYWTIRLTYMKCHHYLQRIEYFHFLTMPFLLKDIQYFLESFSRMKQKSSYQILLMCGEVPMNYLFV